MSGSIWRAIHASFYPRSRAGSDPVASAVARVPRGFYPRSRAGSDEGAPAGQGERTGFYPRSRAGSDLGRADIAVIFHVSIHAPVRGATDALIGLVQRGLFLSTLPCGERRSSGCARRATTQVSIHAPVRGATGGKSDCVEMMTPFLSTLPCGERRTSCPASARLLAFLSTLPCGERHEAMFESLHAAAFLSTLPCGERPAAHCISRTRDRCFYPRSRAGSDDLAKRRQRRRCRFYPRSRAGSDVRAA